MAGTAGGLTYGVCKTCSLVSVKVLGAGGTGTLESILAGLAWVGEVGIPRSSKAHFVVNRAANSRGLGGPTGPLGTLSRAPWTLSR